MAGATVDAHGNPIPEEYQVGAEELANLWRRSWSLSS